jgi:hypothetical protein
MPFVSSFPSFPLPRSSHYAPILRVTIKAALRGVEA